MIELTPSVYELRIYSPTGVLSKSVSNFRAFSCTLAVNKPGLLTADLRTQGETPAENAAIQAVIDTLVDRSQVELWSKNQAAGIGWQPIFRGLHRAQHREHDEAPDYRLSAVGDLWRLSQRIVNYPANTANRTVFTNVVSETLMKTLVEYNAGPSATVANGRKRAGTLTGLVVETDLARGSTIPSWTCFGANLLENLQKLAPQAGGDFDLIKTGAKSWTFRWYLVQRGTDRSGSVQFSLSNGNMGQVVYDYDRIAEKTVGCVWGQGEDAARVYATVTGPDWTADNDIEVYIDARNVQSSDAAKLAPVGNAKLNEARAREQFAFAVLQTEGCMFGQHYNLGDRVGVQNPFTGVLSVQKVTGATITLDSDGKESIDVELTTP